MGQLIKLTVSKRDGRSPISSASCIFDTDDIVTPIRAGGGTSYFTTRLEKGTVAGASTMTPKVNYIVTETLSAVQALTDKFLLLTVTKRRQVIIANELMLFNVDKISETITQISSLSEGTKFYYCEDGDPLPVEYYVVESLDTIISQQASASGFVPYSGAIGNVDLNNKTLTNVKTLGVNAATTSSTPLQFTPSATIPSAPTSGAMWYDTVYGLTVYDSAVSKDAFTVTNGTIRTTLAYVASQGGFIGTSSNHNLTFMTNDAVGAGYGATLCTNGGLKINPTIGVVPTAMLTVQPGPLTNILEFKNAAETVNLLVVDNQGNLSMTPSAVNVGAVTTLSITSANNTIQTLSTEIPGIKYNSFTRQWATGAITTQREVYLNSPTYSAVGASVMTTAYTLYVSAPIAGTNMTITNPYAFGVSGNAQVLGNIVTDTGTGMKIGTATSQKIGIWNATPDVQPTTAIVGGAFVANSSGILNGTATYGGYTMTQVVAALQRLGALA